MLVKTARGRLSFSYFLFPFSFLFNLFYGISIFRTRVRVRVMRSHGHMTSHQPHDEQKDIEDSGRNDIIPGAIHMII